MCKENKHKFEGRYSRKFPDYFSEYGMRMKGNNVDQVKEDIYICDVCVKCGKIASRED